MISFWLWKNWFDEKRFSFLSNKSNSGVKILTVISYFSVESYVSVCIDSDGETQTQPNALFKFMHALFIYDSFILLSEFFSYLIFPILESKLSLNSRINTASQPLNHSVRFWNATFIRIIIVKRKYSL